MPIRNWFSRHLLKHIDVYRIDDFALQPPEVHHLNHEVVTHSMNPSLSVTSKNVLLKIKCKAVRTVLQERIVKAKSSSVRQYVKQDVKVKVHDLKRKVKVYDAMKIIRDMPLELSDMLKYQNRKPKLLPNEILLAWYSPIVEGAVIKLVWNKQRGTLLVWYNPQSRQFRAKGVYLIRKLGFGARPEWRWE